METTSNTLYSSFVKNIKTTGYGLQRARVNEEATFTVNAGPAASKIDQYTISIINYSYFMCYVLVLRQWILKKFNATVSTKLRHIFSSESKKSQMRRFKDVAV